jgi:hypothetical protein
VAENERVRIEIGFEGGQIMGAHVEVSAAEELERALNSGSADGAFQIEAEDGRYTLPLARIVYLKRFAREGRLGFGTG